MFMPNEAASQFESANTGSTAFDAEPPLLEGTIILWFRKKPDSDFEIKCDSI